MTDSATEITKGAPLKVKKSPDIGLAKATAKVVKSAIADPGEWYSIPIPNGTNRSSVGTTIVTQIARTVAEWSAKDERIWIRFYE